MEAHLLKRSDKGGKGKWNTLRKKLHRVLPYILKIMNCAYSVGDFHSLGVVTVRVEGGDGDGGGRGLSLGGFWWRGFTILVFEEEEDVWCMCVCVCVVCSSN